MAQDMEVLLQGVKARHRGELGVVRGLIETLLQPGPKVEALHSVAVDSAGRLFETFVSTGRERERERERMRERRRKKERKRWTREREREVRMDYHIVISIGIYIIRLKLSVFLFSGQLCEAASCPADQEAGGAL